MKDLEQGSAVDFLHSKDLICCSDLRERAELIQCMSYNETHVGDKVRKAVEVLAINHQWITKKT